MAPPILAGVGLGASLLGGVTSAAGSLMGGMSSAAMYNYQAGVANINKQIALQNADYALNAGQTQAAQSGMATRAQIGQTIARQGASNIAVGSGSSADVVASERTIGGINTANILNNAARVAYGYDVQATQDEAQATLYGTAAKTAPIAGAIGAAGSLLSGAGSVASKWYEMGANFGFGGGGASFGGGDIAGALA